MRHTPRLQIRQKNYRGTNGYTVTGTTGVGHRVSIFTYTKTSALQIKAKLAAGLDITSADFAS